MDWVRGKGLPLRALYSLCTKQERENDSEHKRDGFNKIGARRVADLRVRTRCNAVTRNASCTNLNVYLWGKKFFLGT